MGEFVQISLRVGLTLIMFFFSLMGIVRTVNIFVTRQPKDTVVCAMSHLIHERLIVIIVK